MKVDLHDAVGLAGSALFVVAFAYANRAAVLDKRWFNALNLVGALLLLWSLWYKFNLAAFVLEIVWAAIALTGLIAALKSPSRLREGLGVGPGEGSDIGPPPAPPAGRRGEL